MKATEAKLLDFLKKTPQFGIPHVLGLVPQAFERQMGSGKGDA